MVACTPVNTASDGSSSSATDRIVVSEMEGTVAGMSIYQLINSRKPNWLEANRANSFNNQVGVKVYLDESRSPVPIGRLERMRARDVKAVEYYDELSAQSRFGPGHNAGVVVVRTR